MKRIEYLDLIEQLACAYSIKQIEDYIAEVEQRGVWEHGFPRLGANIGILMAHGRLLHLKDYFVRIMDLCCRDIPVPAPECQHRGNDFAVKELCWCLLELEKTDLFSNADIDRWKASLASVDPVTCYHCVAPVPPVRIGNWAAFNAASEQLRNFMGLADTADYIDNQITSQLFSFDENGMYRDPHEPMVYDTVTRLQLANTLYFGYNGTHKTQLERHLRKSAKLSLLMQSVTGELPFGGRSNAFLHNEAHLAAIFEYEALCSKRDGDWETAGACKAAARLAVENIKKWWQENPDHHIKNYYPIYSMEGCEKYAYYDKYMITTASMLYNAYLFADDAIPATKCPAESNESHIWQTGHWFHKLFCKQDDLFVELELEANSQYDASGIGRIHRRGAPSALCLSVPVSQMPKYKTEELNPCPMSICAGVYTDDWHFAWDESSTYCVNSSNAEPGSVETAWDITLAGGEQLRQTCLLKDHTVTVRTEGQGKVALLLPVFLFDGTNSTRVQMDDQKITVAYQGWCCTYKVDGNIVNLDRICQNRNGKYALYRAEGEGTVTVRICIQKEATDE